MTMQGHRGQHQGRVSGAPGAGSTPARLGRSAGANRVAALPFGNEFRTGKRVRLTHLRNSVSKVAEIGCKCLEESKVKKRVEAIAASRQWGRGPRAKGVGANDLRNSVPKVAQKRSKCLVCKGKRVKRAPVRNSVSNGEKRQRKRPSELSSEGCPVALVVRVVLDEIRTRQILAGNPAVSPGQTLRCTATIGVGPEFWGCRKPAGRGFSRLGERAVKNTALFDGSYLKSMTYT